MQEFPQILKDWLKTLPKADKLKQTEIADRNLRRIAEYCANKS